MNRLPSGAKSTTANEDLLDLSRGPIFIPRKQSLQSQSPIWKLVKRSQTSRSSIIIAIGQVSRRYGGAGVVLTGLMASGSTISDVPFIHAGRFYRTSENCIVGVTKSL